MLEHGPPGADPAASPSPAPERAPFRSGRPLGARGWIALAGIVIAALILGELSPPDRPTVAVAHAETQLGSDARPSFEPERIREALDEVRARHEKKIQWELPEPEEREVRSRGFSFLPIGQILLWLLVALAAVILGAVLASWLGDRRPTRVSSGEELGLGPKVALSDEPLVAARAAAARGDYEEAVHLLLLGTIEEIRSALDYDVPPWLTSREVSRAAPIPPAGRPPLDEIIAMVEASYFGTSSIDQAAYERAVSCHGALRAACEGRVDGV